MKLHKSHSDSILVTVPGGLQYEKLFLSLNKIQNLYFHYQEQLNLLLVVLPFLGIFSLNLRKRLYKSVSKSLPQCDIKVIFQSKNRLSSLFTFKASIPLYLHSHLIYKFQCINCNITYYDKTEHYLRVRAGEHISTSSLTGKRANNKKSSVKDHYLLSGHMCSFDDFTILSHTSLKV